MDELIREFAALYDIPELLRLGGLVAVVAIVYIETGLLIGFFLPGDSLLLTAGVFAARGDLELLPLILWTTVAACLGDATGYAIGRRAGQRLYEREESRWFRRRHLLAARVFYARHGGKTIVLSRFVPFLRTFAPVVAGITAMPYPRFALWNVVGGIGWVGSLTTTGYLLGLAVPDLESRIHWLVVGAIALTLFPLVAAAWRQRRDGRVAGAASA